MSSDLSPQVNSQQTQNKIGFSDIARKVSYNLKQLNQHHNVDSLSDSSIKKINQHVHSPERTRRISQYSKEVVNTGHSNQEKDERFRRISQYSRTSEGGEVAERQRKISQYSRDGAHFRDAVLRGYGKARAGTRKEHERYSVVTSGGMDIPVPTENTYKLGPDTTFPSAKVKAIIKNVLHENLKCQKYEPHLMARYCLVLSDTIKEKVRQLRLDRFKIVATVLICEKNSQDLLVSSRCLWDEEHDNFASCEFSQNNLCAVGMVFAVYQE